MTHIHVRRALFPSGAGSAERRRYLEAVGAGAVFVGTEGAESHVKVLEAVAAALRMPEFEDLATRPPPSSGLGELHDLLRLLQHVRYEAVWDGRLVVLDVADLNPDTVYTGLHPLRSIPRRDLAASAQLGRQRIGRTP